MSELLTQTNLQSTPARYDKQILVRNGKASRYTFLEELAPKKAIERDLAHHNRLQTQFNTAIGRIHDSKDLLERAYNPVTDRMHIEKQRMVGNKQGEQAYTREIYENLKTKLKERLQVAVNKVRYDIYGNELSSEHFPAEPFSHVLLRGAEYRLAHGTKEAEREGLAGERGGWKVINQKFTDPETQLGTKMTALSPKGTVKDSSYDRSVVDEYELMEDEKGRYVQLTRYLVDFTEKDYFQAALTLNPNFFVDYDKRPADAWYLAHPQEGTLPNIKQRLQGMSAENFAKIFASTTLQGLINYYVERITAEKVDWRQVAKAFNAILNQVDKEEQRLKNGNKLEQIFMSNDAIHNTVQTLGMITPVQKGGGGCPTSKGFGLSNGGWGLSLSGSVASFSGESGGDGKGSLKFQCGMGHWNERPYGNTIQNCRFCGIRVDCAPTADEEKKPEKAEKSDQPPQPVLVK